MYGTKLFVGVAIALVVAGSIAACAILPLGGRCSAHDQCQSRYCDGGDGTSKTNLCMPNRDGKTGDICSNDNQCASLVCSGLKQEPSGAWTPGKCGVKSPIGTACTQNYQCASTYCDSGNGTSHTDLCMPNKDGKTGDVCSHDNQCTSLICGGLRQDPSGAWIPGACAGKASLGAACTQNFQCASSYCDTGNGTSHTDRCMPNRSGQNGDICSNDNQCTSLVCAGLQQGPSGAWIPGACATKKALGDACAQNYQCTSQYCDTGNGTSHTDRCMPNAGQGQSGDICSDTRQCRSQVCVGLHASGSQWIPGKCQ